VQQRLDHDGAAVGDGQNVRADALQRESLGGAIDFLEKFLRTGVEFRPDFAAVLVEERQGPEHLGALQLGTVGDQDDFDFSGQCGAVQGLDDGPDGLVEIRPAGGLAVAAQRDVVQPAQRRGRVGEAWFGPQLAAGRRRQSLIQLVAQLRQVHRHPRAPPAAVDLTVQATVVARLVNVEIHPDAQPLRPPADYRVDVQAASPLPPVVELHFVEFVFPASRHTRYSSL
jgi:hypothetical protein